MRQFALPVQLLVDFGSGVGGDVGGVAYRRIDDHLQDLEVLAGGGQ